MDAAGRLKEVVLSRTSRFSSPPLQLDSGVGANEGLLHVNREEKQR